MAGDTYIVDSPEGGHSRHLVSYVLVLTLAGGVLLGLIGGSWGRTPAGNTALVVPFAGGSALAAAAWIALTLGLRHHETSGARLALGAGLGGLAALATSLAAIFMPVLGSTSAIMQRGIESGGELEPDFAGAVRTAVAQKSERATVRDGAR
jgi:hypothetical protein